MTKSLLISTKTLTIILVLCLFASFAVKAQTWIIYDGSVLPNLATPAWTSGDAGAPNPSYSIVDQSGNSVLYETSTAAAGKGSFKLPGTQPTN